MQRNHLDEIKAHVPTPQPDTPPSTPPKRPPEIDPPKPDDVPPGNPTDIPPVEPDRGIELPPRERPPDEHLV